MGQSQLSIRILRAETFKKFQVDCAARASWLTALRVCMGLLWQESCRQREARKRRPSVLIALCSSDLFLQRRLQRLFKCLPPLHWSSQKLYSTALRLALTLLT